MWHFIRTLFSFASGCGKSMVNEVYQINKVEDFDFALVDEYVDTD
jgi:hypothetical protein